MSRPEYICCIQRTHEEHRNFTWCWKKIVDVETPFRNIDHAAHTRLLKDRLLVCPECTNAVVAALRDAT